MAYKVDNDLEFLRELNEILKEILDEYEKNPSEVKKNFKRTFLKCKIS